MRTFDLWSILLLGGSLHGVFMAVALSASRRGNGKSKLVLAVLMLAVAGVLSEYLTIRNGFYFLDRAHNVVFLTTPLYFLFGPCFYLYVQSRTAQRSEARSRSWPHLLLPFMVFCNFAPAYLRLLNLMLVEARDYFFPVSGYWYMGFQIFQAGCYLLLAERALRAFERAGKSISSHSTLVGLEWLRKLTLVFAGVLVIHALALGFLILQRHVVEVEYALALTLAAVIYVIGFDAFRAPEIFSELALTAPAEKYQKSALSAAQAQAYCHKLLRSMATEKLYRKSELKLADLATRLAISPNHLSQALNQELHLNFFDFVNQYRVQEVQARLLDERYRHLTHLAIALEAGFSNKTSFNRVFKKFTHMSPSAFVQANRKADNHVSAPAIPETPLPPSPQIQSAR